VGEGIEAFPMAGAIGRTVRSVVGARLSRHVLWDREHAVVPQASSSVGLRAPIDLRACDAAPWRLLVLVLRGEMPSTLERQADGVL